MVARARSILDYDSIEQAFPEVDPGLVPFGSRVLVQKRSPREVTKGGIVVPHESQETEFWNTQVAKVITFGPAAFRNRDNLDQWPEGKWCEEGDFVRVPKYGGDTWFVDLPDNDAQKACFVLFNDLDLIGKITCNPMDVIAYL